MWPPIWGIGKFNVVESVDSQQTILSDGLFWYLIGLQR